MIWLLIGSNCGIYSENVTQDQPGASGDITHWEWSLKKKKKKHPYNINRDEDYNLNEIRIFIL